MNNITGKSCKLLKPIRDRGGKSRFKEENPIIIREDTNLDRKLYLIRFADGASTYIFPDEVEIIDGDNKEDN